MGMLDFTIDADSLPEDEKGSYEPMPAGWYQVRISEADVAITKSGTGQMIKMTLDVIGPSHEGRKVWTNLNIKNDSEVAERIGKQQLGKVMRACNLPSLNDTDQLIGGTMEVKLVIKQDPEYGDKNEVKDYRAMSSAVAPTATASAPAAQAPTGSKPPWAK